MLLQEAIQLQSLHDFQSQPDAAEIPHVLHTDAVQVNGSPTRFGFFKERRLIGRPVLRGRFQARTAGGIHLAQPRDRALSRTARRAHRLDEFPVRERLPVLFSQVPAQVHVPHDTRAVLSCQPPCFPLHWVSEIGPRPERPFRKFSVTTRDFSKNFQLRKLG